MHATLPINLKSQHYQTCCPKVFCWYVAWNEFEFQIRMACYYVIRARGTLPSFCLNNKLPRFLNTPHCIGCHEASCCFFHKARKKKMNNKCNNKKCATTHKKHFLIVVLKTFRARFLFGYLSNSRRPIVNCPYETLFTKSILLNVGSSRGTSHSYKSFNHFRITIQYSFFEL